MDIYSYFSHKNIINNLAKYELFYQVSLGSIISQTNSKEIEFDIEFQYALGSIYELLQELKELDEVDDVLFNNELKKQASMDALQHFTNENIELVKNNKIDIENFIHQINEDVFFNTTMNKICEDNLEIQINKWEEIITPDLSEAILDSLKKMN